MVNVKLHLIIKADVDGGSLFTLYRSPSKYGEIVINFYILTSRLRNHLLDR